MRLKVLLGLFLVCSISSAWADVETKEDNLKAYEQQIKTQKEKLKKLGGREGSLLREVNRLSSQVNKLERKIDGLDREKKNLEERIDKTNGEISRLSKDVRSRDARVKKRLRELYMHGKPNYMKVLLAAESPLDFRKRRFLVTRWVNHDRQLIGEYQTKVVELSEQKSLLEADRQQHKVILKKLSGQKRALSRDKTEQSQLLALVRNQQSFYEKSIRELEQAAKDLQKLIETLRKQESEGTSLFASLKGKLPMPVYGKLEKKYGSYFDSRLRTKLYHKGVDLRVKKGTPIKAVFDGRVIYAGWFVGYGQVIILNHGGGYFTLYAHASELFKEVNDTVVAGETIAKVGDTGSLKGAYLYFELRHKGLTQNPWPWFAKRGS